MSLKKLLISGVTALTLATVGATAADNTNTSLATDGTGDYLIFPYYAAIQGWETHLRVVNTNPTDAIVAKVVFREYKDSAEVLDFPIYLSPGDVWEGTVIQDKDGKIRVQSDDDSLILPQSDREKLFLNPKLGGKDPSIGYIEVFGVAQIKASDVDPFFEENFPLDKNKLKKKYSAELNGKTYTGEEWRGVDKDSLYAEEILLSKDKKLAMTLPATALEGVTGAIANDNNVFGSDTRIDKMIRGNDETSDNDPTLVNKVLGQMESALNKTHIYLNFYDEADNTALILTQPLAKYKIGYNKSFLYSAIGRDTQENSIIRKEEESEISGHPKLTKKEGCLEGYEICIITTQQIKNKIKNPDTGNYFENGYIDFSLKKKRAIIPVLMSVKKVGGELRTNIVYAPSKN